MAEKEQKVPATNHEEEEKDNIWCYNRTQKEWIMLLHSIPGGIILVVLACLNWNECDAIPSLQYMVLFFGITHIVSQLIKFFKRTEMLIQTNHGFENTWVTIDTILGLSLVGMAIWGATITFGSTEKVGNGPGQCKRGIFYPGLIASAICFAIVVFIVLPLIVMEVMKTEEGNDASSEQETPVGPNNV